MNMSFFLTTDQFRNQTKNVTRRQGWRKLKPGMILMGIFKGQGLKKGETVKPLGRIEVVSVRRERIEQVTCDDVIKEGFPGETRNWFIAMYCKANKCKPWHLCTRIEFKYRDVPNYGEHLTKPE